MVLTSNSILKREEKVQRSAMAEAGTSGDTIFNGNLSTIVALHAAYGVLFSMSVFFNGPRVMIFFSTVKWRHHGTLGQ